MSIDLHEPKNNATSHSATVEMWLHIGSTTIAVSQSAPRELMVQDIAAVTNGNAVVEVIVDGRSHKRSVNVTGPGRRPNWIAIEER